MQIQTLLLGKLFKLYQILASDMGSVHAVNAIFLYQKCN